MYRCINLFKYGLKEGINIEKYSCWEGLEANRHCYTPEGMLKMVIDKCQGCEVHSNIKKCKVLDVLITDEVLLSQSWYKYPEMSSNLSRLSTQLSQRCL